MEYNSDDIREEFNQNVVNLKNQEKRGNKIKIGLLYTSFIVAFIFIFTGTVFSFLNYEKAKDNSNSELKVIQNVVVKEY